MIREIIADVKSKSYAVITNTHLFSLTVKNCLFFKYSLL